MRGWTLVVCAIIAAVFLTGAPMLANPSSTSEWLAVVRLHDNAGVTGPNILLGEIAEIESGDPRLGEQLRSLVVGRAPLPGQRRELRVATMKTRMRQQRLPVAQIALLTDNSEVIVYTKAATVSGEDLMEVAREALLDHASNSRTVVVGDGVVQMQCSLPEPVTVAVGAPTLRLQRTSGSVPGALIAVVDVVVSGVVAKSVTVRCDAVLEQNVLVTMQTLKRHDALQPGMYATETRTFAAVPRDGLLPSLSPERWRLTRPVAPGTVLTYGMVETIPLVQRGDQVRIIAATGGISVTAPGIALTDGAADDIIRVENALSGQVVQARVADAETVAAVLR